MECIFTQIEAFFTGKIWRYFNRHFITFISCILDQPICFTEYRRSLVDWIYIYFLFTVKFILRQPSSCCSSFVNQVIENDFLVGNENVGTEAADIVAEAA